LGPEAESSSVADLRIAVGIALSTAAVVSLLLLTAASTLRARLNVVQAAAVLFFLAVAARYVITKPAATAGATGDGKRHLGLWLPLAVGGAVWLVMVPFYFIGDDFEHLARAQGPLIASLWDLTIHGQLGAFLRPVGFATLFLDYRLYGLWPPGYHMTNLLIHLACVAGIYCLSSELRLGWQTASLASLIYAVLPIEAEAVAWIGARFDLLAAWFMIWGSVFYLKYRWTGHIGNYAVALFCFCLAVFSKENAFVFPFLVAAIEYLVLPKPGWRPLAGCFLLASALFVHRWLVLGGIGGYSNSNGQPMAFHAGFKVLQGVFLRAPSLLLFGYNWAQPRLATTIVVFSLTVAILLAIVFLSKPAPGGWKGLCFGVAWMLLPLSPAHPFLLITADLRTSRVLYAGAAGLAILLAQLLAGVRPTRIRWGAAGLLICLLSAGALHNLGAWRSASGLEEKFLAEVKRAEPSPPRNAEFVFYNMPTQVLGIDFHLAGLGDALRIAFGRADLDARRAGDAPGQPHEPKRPEIHMLWRGTESGSIAIQGMSLDKISH
jgi:hypothetical protein